MLEKHTKPFVVIFVPTLFGLLNFELSTDCSFSKIIMVSKKKMEHLNVKTTVS